MTRTNWTRFAPAGSTTGFNDQPFPVSNALVERDGHNAAHLFVVAHLRRARLLYREA